MCTRHYDATKKVVIHPKPELEQHQSLSNNRLSYDNLGIPLHLQIYVRASVLVGVSVSVFVVRRINPLGPNVVVGILLKKEP